VEGTADRESAPDELRDWSPAHNGDRNGTFDLMITDVGMPQMNGTELIERVRARLPNLPVIAMSGYLENTLSLPSSAEAPVRFIEKPFAMDSMIAAVRDLLGAGVS
jgi:two-component system cell cycle sensor histidine kinase/response regulator CckA